METSMFTFVNGSKAEGGGAGALAPGMAEKATAPRPTSGGGKRHWPPHDMTAPTPPQRAPPPTTEGRGAGADRRGGKRAGGAGGGQCRVRGMWGGGRALFGSDPAPPPSELLPFFSTTTYPQPFRFYTPPTACHMSLENNPAVSRFQSQHLQHSTI